MWLEQYRPELRVIGNFDGGNIYAAIITFYVTANQSPTQLLQHILTGVITQKHDPFILSSI